MHNVPETLTQSGGPSPKQERKLALGLALPYFDGNPIAWLHELARLVYAERGPHEARVVERVADAFARRERSLERELADTQQALEGAQYAPHD